MGRTVKTEEEMIARDLCYSPAIIKAIQNAKTESERQRLLMKGRKEKFG